MRDPISLKYKPLVKDDYDAIQKRFAEFENGQPRAYALVGEYFMLRPVPDAVYTIRMKGYIADSLLTTNIENKWLKYAAEWITAETAGRVATFHIRDLELAQVFLASIPGFKERVYEAGIARQMANMNMSIGDDP